MNSKSFMNMILATCILSCHVVRSAATTTRFFLIKGDTVLHTTARTTNIATLQRAIENGQAQDRVDRERGILTIPFIDRVNSLGNTALMEAVIHNNKDAVEELILARASLDIQNNRGETAMIQGVLYAYASNNKSDEENEAIRARIVEMLYNRGANINIYDNKGFRASTYAINASFFTPLGEWFKTLPNFKPVTQQEQELLHKERAATLAYEHLKATTISLNGLYDASDIFVNKNPKKQKYELQQSAQKIKDEERKRKNAEEAASKMALQLEREEKQAAEKQKKIAAKQRKIAEAIEERTKLAKIQQAEKIQREQQEAEAKLKAAEQEKRAAEQEKTAKIIAQVQKQEKERLQWLEQAKKEMREQQALKNQHDEEARRITSLIERINSVGLGSLQLTCASPESVSEEPHEASDYVAHQGFMSELSECKEFKQDEIARPLKRMTIAKFVMDGIGSGKGRFKKK